MLFVTTLLVYHSHCILGLVKTLSVPSCTYTALHCIETNAVGTNESPER